MNSSDPAQPNNDHGVTGDFVESDPADEQSSADQPVASDAETDGAQTITETAEATDAERIAELETQVSERLSDLQRLQAEYVNYKRRVDRDRDVARRAGAEKVLSDLLGVLDNIGTARQHEEMSDGFKAVANNLEQVARGNGLVPFGDPGDMFDPQVHEAMMQTEMPGLTVPTAVEILQVGYRLGDRVLRPARVIVAQPTDESAEPTQEA